LGAIAAPKGKMVSSELVDLGWTLQPLPIVNGEHLTFVETLLVHCIVLAGFGSIPIVLAGWLYRNASVSLFFRPFLALRFTGHFESDRRARAPNKSALTQNVKGHAASIPPIKETQSRQPVGTFIY